MDFAPAVGAERLRGVRDRSPLAAKASVMRLMSRVRPVVHRDDARPRRLARRDIEIGRRDAPQKTQFRRRTRNKLLDQQP